MPISDVFKVVSRHNQWLSVRQSLVAGNVANANTPGFKTLDVTPFEKVLETTSLEVSTPRPGHMNIGAPLVPAADVKNDEAWEVTHSGNTVSLEQELMKAGEVGRAYRLNTSVAKAFHRMLLASAKA